MIKVGENALAEFLDVFIEWETTIVKELRTNRQIKRMSAQKREEYKNATECYIFYKPVKEDDPKGPKVRYNDHITGFFIGAAQSKCNLERPVSFRISVLFHNFRGYDEHLIVHEFEKRPVRKIKVIGQNIEKYLQVKLKKEHRLFRLVPVPTCFSEATHGLARQNRLWKLLQSPRGSLANLP